MSLDYNPLFQGAARLGLLLGAIDLPWNRVTPYVEAFASELNAYQELSLDSTATTVGLMTRGSGKDFAFRIARYLENHGIDESRLRCFLVRAKFLEYQNLFFKVEINSAGVFEFSYYFRQRVSLEVVGAWLRDTGVDTEGLAYVYACAKELQKQTVHFLATAERPQGESLEKVYFSQPQDREAWDRVKNASYLTGLSENGWQPLVPFQTILRHQPLFLSLAFSGGQFCPGIKLDIQGVTPDIVETLMQQAECSPEVCKRTQLLLNLFEKQQFDYLGVHLNPNNSFDTKVYVYQSCD
jgi:hypothetical protein